MQVPPEIVVRDVTMTPYIDRLITRGIDRLEKVCDYIISARIALDRAQGRRMKGNLFRMRIDIRIPDRSDIVVEHFSKAPKKIAVGRQLETQQALEEEMGRERPRVLGRNPVQRQSKRDEPLTALIRHTFDSARRELEKVVDKQRGEVKTPSQQQVQAVVEKMFPEQDYGFLRTLDGQQVYFHRNSVLHKHWERLRAGVVVRYTPEMGEKGLQASTVEPVDKPGASEIHNELHDLPEVSPLPRRSGKVANGRRNNR
jgi:cold shock CspA family protein